MKNQLYEEIVSYIIENQSRFYRLAYSYTGNREAALDVDVYKRQDLSGMVAGSKYRGEFEERIKKVISEVRDDGDVLLFIDEIHTIIRCV